MGETGTNQKKHDSAKAETAELGSVPPSKICIGCKKERSLEDFHKNKGKSDGRQAECKACTSKKKKSQYKKKKRRRQRTVGFDVETVGESDIECVESFSKKMADLIQELIDEGKI